MNLWIVPAPFQCSRRKRPEKDKKMEVIQRVCNPIMMKPAPAPAPPKEEADKKEDAAPMDTEEQPKEGGCCGGCGKNAEAETTEAMETDANGVD